MSYKPSGYPDVAPYLIVADIEACMVFLEQAFNATRKRFDTRPDGSPLHAEALIGDTIVMMGQASGGPAAHVHVYVPDVRATFEACCRAGGVAVQAPVDKGDGDLRAGIRDPQGTTWWPSSQISQA